MIKFIQLIGSKPIAKLILRFGMLIGTKSTLRYMRKHIPRLMTQLIPKFGQPTGSKHMRQRTVKIILRRTIRIMLRHIRPTGTKLILRFGIKPGIKIT